MEALGRVQSAYQLTPIINRIQIMHTLEYQE